MTGGWVIRSLSRSAAGLALAFLACSEPTGGTSGAPLPTAPTGVSGAPTGGAATGSSTDETATQTTLLACPTSDTQSATKLLDPLVGGTVSVGGSSVTLSAGFISAALPVPVTLTIPASQYVEANVTIAGLEHPPLLPGTTVTFVIDYSRCGRSDLTKRALAAWNIDPETKALLEFMGGVDDKLTQTVTFSTSHLSSYAIAF